MEDRSVIRSLPTHDNINNEQKHIDMHGVGFEHTNQTSKRAKTPHALNSVANVTPYEIT
jgi:hypothetical protein